MLKRQWELLSELIYTKLKVKVSYFKIDQKHLTSFFKQNLQSIIRKDFISLINNQTKLSNGKIIKHS